MHITARGVCDALKLSKEAFSLLRKHTGAELVGETRRPVGRGMPPTYYAVSDVIAWADRVLSPLDRAAVARLYEQAVK